MSVLDNPSWHALAGAQRQFGVVGERAGRYRSDISPIAGLADRSAEALEELAGLVEAGTFAAVFAPGEIAGELRRLWRLAAVVPLSQWICPRPVATAASADEVVDLGADDAAAMYRLAKATDPGPFESATHRLGHYVGIRADGQLVAMAGERMRIVADGASYREVSAVCTDAACQGTDKEHNTRQRRRWHRMSRAMRIPASYDVATGVDLVDCRWKEAKQCPCAILSTRAKSSASA